MDRENLKNELAAFLGRFSRAYEPGVTATAAWDTALKGCGCAEVASSLREVGRAWAEGGRLADAFRKPELTSETVATALYIGEEVGALKKIAEQTGHALADGLVPVQKLTKADLPEHSGQLRQFLAALTFLVDVGCPLLTGLRAVQADLDDCEITEAIGIVASEIQGGSTLSEAMEVKAPAGAFPPVVYTMVRAGEAGGVLDVILQRLVKGMDKGVLGLARPDPAELTEGAAQAERARIWYLMGSLISSGVPILEAFELLRDDTIDPALQGWLGTTKDALRGGSVIAECMRDSEFQFQESEIEAINRGEETGDLPRMLFELADQLSGGCPGDTEELVGVPAGGAGSEVKVAPETSGDEEPGSGRQEAPVVKLVNLVLQQAIKDNATDVHFETYEDRFVIRYRVDGTLYEMQPPPRHLALAILSRLKIMGGLDIAERRLPQDGRIELNISGERIDLRVSTLPTVTGEHCTLRILRPEKALLGLEHLGLSAADLATMRSWGQTPNGLFVLSGPVGSGKTTTLLSVLHEINRPSQRIITVEDPVEYRLSGISQIEVKRRIGLDMPRAIVSALRQEPDVLALARVEQPEALGLACRAAMDGRLVFAEINAADAVSAILRMLDMGCEAALLSGALAGVCSQRLVRKLCACRREVGVVELDEREREAVKGRSAKRYFVPNGCEECHKLGFKGRTGIYELLTVTDELRAAVRKGASPKRLGKVVGKQHFTSMRDDGLAKAATGETSVAEILRVTG